MIVNVPSSLAVKNGTFVHTAGTIRLPTGCRSALVSLGLAANAGYTVAVKQSVSASATASKANCSRILATLNTGDTNIIGRPAGAGIWYLAFRIYNGATAAAGSSSDKYAIDCLD